MERVAQSCVNANINDQHAPTHPSIGVTRDSTHSIATPSLFQGVPRTEGSGLKQHLTLRNYVQLPSLGSHWALSVNIVPHGS